MDRQPNAETSINIFDLIDQICSEYRRQWRAGHRPSIEEYLVRVPENAQPTLFRNLLKQDIDSRRRKNEHPSTADYIGRFPNFKTIVRREFDEYTLASDEGMVSTPGGEFYDHTLTVDSPAANRIGDYELVRELGRGGMGVVYEAVHLNRGNRTALKTLPTGVDGQSVNADRLHRFRKEFRSLSDINHPNLVGMQTLETDGSQWFFTMDLVEGTDFLSYVRPNGKVDIERLRDSVRQLVEGIAFLHEKRILHRDLKPSNVLVRNDGRVQILDFGLITELDLGVDEAVSQQTSHFVGTPRYSAPEQFLGERSPAADWYALGTMLYEALEGAPPFREVQGVIARKQQEDAPELDAQQALDSQLAELANQLLKRVPTDRPEFEQIYAMVGGPDSEGATVATTRLRTEPNRPNAIHLVGRDSHFELLQNALRKLEHDGTTLAVFIRGLSGEGKSSLAHAFLAPLRQRSDLIVLSGRCYDRESVPFKAIDAAIDALSDRLRQLDQATVRSFLPRDVGLLAHLFPALGRVPAIADLPTQRLNQSSGDLIKRRAFHAFRELMSNLSAEIPVMLMIEDLQWGDADSAKELWHLLTDSSEPRILFLGNYRSDEADESPFLDQWKKCQVETNATLAMQELTVSPLDQEEILELVKQRVEGEHAKLVELAELLKQDTGGNPYLLEQLIESFDPETGKLDRIPLKEVIERRFTRLPTEARQLLSVICIAGQSISFEEVITASRLGKSSISTLTHMSNERLIRMIGTPDDPQVDVYHDKIRETVSKWLPNSERQQLHLDMALAIIDVESQRHQLPPTFPTADSKNLPDEVPHKVFDLAYHFAEANDDRAFIYQLLAGEEAARAYALDESLSYLSRAESLLASESSDETKYRTFEAIAQVFLRLKDGARSRSYFKRAIAHASTIDEQAAANVGIAMCYQQVGDFSDATRHYDEALIALGTKRPIRKLAVIVSANWLLGRLLIAPGLWKRRSSEKTRQKAKLKFRIGPLLTWYLFESDTLQSFQSTLAQAASAIQADDDGLLAITYGDLAFSFAMLGLTPFTNIFLKRAESLHERVDDPEIRGHMLGVLAHIHYMAADPRTAIGEFDAAIDQTKRCGHHHELIMQRHTLRHCHSFASDSATEAEHAMLELQGSLEAADERAHCWGHYGLAWAHARAGNLSEANRRMTLALDQIGSESRNMTEVICRGHHGFVLLQSSQYSLATQELEKSLTLAQRNLLYNDYAINSYPMLLMSITGPNWLSPNEDVDKRSLKRHMRRGKIYHWMYLLQRAGISRALGRSRWVLGQERKALRYFERSVVEARRLGESWELSRSLLDLAAAKGDEGDTLRSEGIEMLKRLKSVIPRAESWLLADQYDSSVVAPEFDYEASKQNEQPS